MSSVVEHQPHRRPALVHGDFAVPPAASIWTLEEDLAFACTEYSIVCQTLVFVLVHLKHPAMVVVEASTICR